MKVVILAGGLGTRLSEETRFIPKPMVEIAEKPIIWHIMKIFSHQGFNDFVICLGYKGIVIKEYFMNHFIHHSDFSISLKDNRVQIHGTYAEPWNITLVDTGLETKTGGRLTKIKKFLNNESFMMTYGDGLADIDLIKLNEFHKSHGKLATVTAVIPEGRFGIMKLDGTSVIDFSEKKKDQNRRINGGFFVLEPGIFDYISGDVMWETSPLESLAKQGQLAAYLHNGYWMAMDKLSDKLKLESIWSSGKAPWKIWNKESDK